MTSMDMESKFQLSDSAVEKIAEQAAEERPGRDGDQIWNEPLGISS